MRHICLHFQIHQPFMLRTYRFFDIGLDHYYYDDFSNKSNIFQVAKDSYIPMNKLLLETIKKQKNKFKVSFSISGSALEQFELYTPEVIESFQELAQTGKVEFTAQPYSHSLVSIKSEEEFTKQVQRHSDKIQELFGTKPSVFHNTHFIYSNYIGELILNMGYKGVIAEGAKHILGWKSPNFMYCNANNPKLKILLRNYKLSDDIALRFSQKTWDQWPLTSKKITEWINQFPKDEEIINLCMDYETFGVYQTKSSGIFDFMKDLPKTIIADTDFSFSTPSDIIKKAQPVSVLSVPNNTSNADEERDLSAWLGNNLQLEAFNALYKNIELIHTVSDSEIIQDWYRLQSSDNFYNMSTKFFADGGSPLKRNPYSTPYEAFINFMNIVGDFNERVKKAPKIIEEAQLSPQEINEAIAKHTAALEQLVELKKKKKK
ncbi:MAG: glycoside hydrolase family 57 protein [Bacteroidales bacterium]|jgi:alpha-amylase|nr:glycoside hydrolase family 57 protein [Bacteroidales bacterium]